MNFLDFKNTFQGFPVFSTLDIRKYDPGFNVRNLVRWQDKRYLLRIRNNWYTFSDQRWEEVLLFWAANRIYAPSYISLESALSYYHLIPEGVFSIQSVSPLKTNLFQTPIGNFQYSNVKPFWFFGYQMVKIQQFYAAVAEPEKALLDLLYLRPELETAVQFEALRLNMFELKSLFNPERFEAYVQASNNKALSARALNLMLFIQNYHSHADIS